MKRSPLPSDHSHPRALAALVLIVAWLAPVAGADGQTAPKESIPAAKQAASAQGARPAPKSGQREFKLVLEPRALDLLKATGARLAAAKSLSFTATVSYEFPSKLGPPIQYTSRYDVALQRPNQLRVLNLGDGPVSEFYYDGKAMMAYAPAEDLVAVADAPATVDAALRQAYETAAIYFPFTDLLADDPYAVLTDRAMLAFYIGPSAVVGGVKTDMVAWANDAVFVQIWIGVDDKLPRRVRALFRTDPLQLRHEMDLSNWQLDATLGTETFASQKAQAAKRIAFTAPGAPPPGMKPPARPAAVKPATKSP